MKRLFISHSSQDRPEAMKLVAELEARGVECWIDQKDIPKGADYAASIMQGLRDCDATLVLLSESSVRSAAVRREIEQANALGHRFYPVRLLDVVLADELAFFLKADHWVDLFTGDRPKTYARLASAILEGRELAVRRSRRVRAVLWSVLAVLMVAIGLAGWAIIGSLDEYETAISGTETPDEHAGPFAKLWMQIEINPPRNDELTEFRDATFNLQGAPLQKDAVEVAVYALHSDTRLERIAHAEENLVVNSGFQVLPMQVLTKPDNILICLRFRAASGRDGAGPEVDFIAIQRRFAHSMLDPDRSVEQVAPGVGCDTYLSVADENAELEEFERKSALADVLAANAKLTILELVPDLNYPGRHFVEMQLDRVSDPIRNILTSAVLVVETSSDGVVWVDPAVWSLSEPVTRSVFPADSRLFSATLIGELQPYVRVCLSSGLSDGSFVHDTKVFHRADSGVFEPFGDPVSMTFDPDGVYCLRNVSQKPTESAMQNIQGNEIILPGSDRASELDDRATALERLRDGVPSTYGPAFGGFRLGMPFAEAMGLAQTMLPDAVRSRQTKSVHSFFTGDYFELVDGKSRQSLALVSFEGVDALAAMRWSFFPADMPLDMKRLPDHLNIVFGQDVQAFRQDFWNRLTMFWTDTDNYKCVLFGLMTHMDMGINWPTDDPSCGSVLVFSGVNFKDSGGPSRASFGLFDFQAAREIHPSR